MIISHLKANDDGTYTVQSNEDHCSGVAALAAQFAEAFGFAEWGRAMGHLHDSGKERDSFQNYIRQTSGYDPLAPYYNEDKSHAFVGAVIAKNTYGYPGLLIANQIAGHHAGLYDSYELNETLKRDIPTEVNTNISKITLPADILRTYQPEEAHHLIRMLYSCLVDADYLDTERFMNLESFASRKNKTTMGEIGEMLQTRLYEFRNSPDSTVNRIRNQVQNECLKASFLPQGFYSLTVPTGGGKTISSIVWAVNHAIKNGKNRIIIAIPYTSIIVQTAAELKSIFGEENVLEHHSNADFEKCKDAKLRHRMKLATENWDYPIVVTTNVQLFESIFSYKPSNCRKLHNICNSVLILDEVQTLPTDFLQPIIDSLKCYHNHFGVSVLFTTASQPILSGVIEGCSPRAIFEGIDAIHEIIPKDLDLHNSLRRVKLVINDVGRSYDDVSKELLQHEQVLCIVNTRRDAKELCERLPQEGTLHLSRMMCPAHIMQTINTIKDTLKNELATIRVISTQLIEAGVDIDFPVVYRQEAGLDSVLQAAGRCNREGKHELGITHVFSLTKERALPPGFIKNGNTARKLLRADSDWFDPRTMTSYFEFYYRRCQFDEKQIKPLLYDPREMYFKTASDTFRLIDDAGTSVIVNWENSMELINQLKKEGPSYHLLKQLGQYSVNLRINDFDFFLKNGLVEEVMEGVYVAYNRMLYNEKVGLQIEKKWPEEIMII